jgi:hypothetical protein
VTRIVPPVRAWYCGPANLDAQQASIPDEDASRYAVLEVMVSSMPLDTVTPVEAEDNYEGRFRWPYK